MIIFKMDPVFRVPRHKKQTKWEPTLAASMRSVGLRTITNFQRKGALTRGLKKFWKTALSMEVSRVRVITRCLKDRRIALRGFYKLHCSRLLFSGVSKVLFALKKKMDCDFYICRTLPILPQQPIVRFPIVVIFHCYWAT